MAIEFKLPELGENIASGDIVNVLVAEGDVIAANDGVVELETDKAVIEIPCPHAGTIVKLNVKRGDTVKVGQSILTLDGEEDAAAGTSAMSPAAAPRVEGPVPSVSPPQMEDERDTPTAPAGGIAVGATVAAAGRKASASVAAKTTGVVPAGPAARRLARELGVDLRAVSGSGKHGRITPEDVEAAGSATASAPTASGAQAGASRAAGPASHAAQAMATPYAPVIPPGEAARDAWGAIRRERMSKIRQTIAAQMSKSASTIPHVTNFDDADVTELDALRTSVPQGFLGDGLKLTAMPFVLKAVALALRRHPALNAALDEQNQQIVYKEYVNLGVAVDTPRGLVVPAMRNVDQLSIVEIARALAGIAQRARGGQFAIEELRGGTFTISNLGAVGGTYSTPVINHPEVAILLLGRTRWLPVVRQGEIVPRFMLPLSLSYDHRLVDGAVASRFLNEVIDWLQSPGKLLLV